MKQKLILERQLTLEELQKEIDKGHKFVVFQYCISLLFAVTLRRFSPAILITSEDQFLKYKRKYNRISYCCGWWGIPWGPINTITSLRVNSKGGVDVTDDIMLNITNEGLAENEIDLKISNQLYCKPDKWDKKAFIRALSAKFETDYNIRQLVVGYFINTQNDDSFYTIGLRADKNYEEYKEPLKQALYKQFTKYTRFEFVDLNEENASHRLLEKQGEFIINRVQNGH